MKYFATFELPCTSDIIAFSTAAERDDWVNFRDHLSVSSGTTAVNAFFDRKALTAAEAERLIDTLSIGKYRDRVIDAIVYPCLYRDRAIDF